MLAKKPHVVVPVLALTAAVLGACGETPLTEPVSDFTGALTPAWLKAADLSGTWQWWQTTKVAARPFTAVLFGIQPEGPITQFTCESAGQLTINAVTASTFVGSATQSSICVTRGGIVFNPSLFPPSLHVANGEIRGHSFRFDFTDGGIPCPQAGAIHVQNGTAVELRGSGDCALPNASEVGQYRDIQFTAKR